MLSVIPENNTVVTLAVQFKMAVQVCGTGYGKGIDPLIKKIFDPILKYPAIKRRHGHRAGYLQRVYRSARQ